MMVIFRVLLGGFMVLFVAACGAPGSGVEVRDPWVRAAVVTGAAMPADATAMAHGHGADHGASHGAATDVAAMPMGGSTSAAYMVLQNQAATADVLIQASTDVAEVVELHTVERDGDIMRMRPVQQIDLPARGSATLEPGGLHIMLIGLRQDLQPGQTVRLTLTFANAGEVVVEVPVRGS
jgi:copper(I)-binding protein